MSAKTRKLIEENTTFVDLEESLRVFKIDWEYAARLDELPTPADKAAALPTYGSGITDSSTSSTTRRSCRWLTQAAEAGG